MSIGMVLDLLLLVLLGATLAGAVILSRRLGALRRDGEDMRQRLSAFNEAAATAEQTLAALKEATVKAGRRVPADKGTFPGAAGLRGDLEYLIGQGNLLADRLESAVRDGRAARRPAPAPAQESRPGSRVEPTFAGETPTARPPGGDDGGRREPWLAALSQAAGGGTDAMTRSMTTAALMKNPGAPQQEARK